MSRRSNDVILFHNPIALLTSCISLLNCPVCGCATLYALEGRQVGRWRFVDEVFCDCSWPRMFTADDFDPLKRFHPEWTIVSTVSSEDELADFFDNGYFNTDFYGFLWACLADQGLIGSTTGEEYE